MQLCVAEGHCGAAEYLLEISGIDRGTAQPRRTCESTRGKDGGYRLAKPADEITVAEIMAITEGSLAPVSCLETCADGQCVHADGCLTMPMWQKLDAIIDEFLSGVTLQDILDRRI